MRDNFLDNSAHQIMGVNFRATMLTNVVYKITKNRIVKGIEC